MSLIFIVNFLTFSKIARCHYCYESIPNCKDCNNNPALCATCQFNYYLFDPSGGSNYVNCVSCHENTRFKLGLHNGSGICRLCSHRFNNCSECDNQRCTKCDASFYLFKTETATGADDCDVCTAADRYVSSSGKKRYKKYNY